MKKFISRNERETIDFAKNFAQNLKGGEVIALSGDLGAGKTAFTKGLAEYFQIKQKITSPTFVFMKVYDTKKLKDIKKLVHVDAYRLDDKQDFSPIGIQEYLGDKNVVSVIEWPERLKKIIPKNSLKIQLKYLDENSREISY